MTTTAVEATVAPQRVAPSYPGTFNQPPEESVR